MSKPQIKLFFAPVLLGLLGLVTLSGCDDRSEETSGEKVALTQVPPPVKATG